MRACSAFPYIQARCMPPTFQSSPLASLWASIIVDKCVEFKVSPAVENMDSTGTLDAQGVNSVSLDAGV